jgi:hypothetical protein
MHMKKGRRLASGNSYPRLPNRQLFLAEPHSLASIPLPKNSGFQVVFCPGLRCELPFVPA